MSDAAGRGQRELAAYKGLVRSSLIRFGVSEADLDDLTQEVWLVALARSPKFEDERATAAWLVQVCRRLAAGERRSRARNVLCNDSQADFPIDGDQFEHIEREFDEQESLAALSRLSEAQLDVLTLYGSGELSMREVAALIGEPEPTVYARYRAAIEEVLRDLRRSAAVGRRTSTLPPQRMPSTPPSVPPPDREGAADLGELIIYRCDREFAIGRIGNIVLANWRKRVFETSAADVGATINFAYERLQVPIVLLNTAAPDLALPNARERSALRHHIHDTARHTVIAIDVADNLAEPVTRLLTTIVNGIMLITRADRRVSFAMVSSLEAARSWVEPNARTAVGPLAWERVARAVHAMRHQGPCVGPALASSA